MRGTRLEQLHALYAWWERRHGAAAREFAATFDAVLRRFEIDRNRYSNVFEPSFSSDGDGESFRRFSYAFPGFRAAPEDCSRALAEMAAPWGGAISGACARLIAAARHDAVAQPLIGLADDGARGTRIKLYLQFHDGATEPAAALTRALVGAPLDPARLGGALHMLGLDLGASGGLRGAKLYVVPSEPRAPLGAPLAKTLLVHRVGEPGGDFFAAAPEIDFPVEENRLTARDVLESPRLGARHADALRSFRGLMDELPIVLRRVSLGDGKINLYYVPAVS